VPDRALRGVPSRRSVLVTAAAGLVLPLTGCDPKVGPVRLGQPGGSPTTPGPDADERARGRAAATADRLAATALATARTPGRRPGDAALLRRVAADHVAHARALRPPAGPVASGSGSSSPSPSTPSTTSAPAVAVANPAALAALEHRAAAEALADLASVSAGAARLLASVGAGRAVHAAELAARR
jgi:hypothetical protein